MRTRPKDELIRRSGVGAGLECWGVVFDDTEPGGWGSAKLTRKESIQVNNDKWDSLCGMPLVHPCEFG